MIEIAFQKGLYAGLKELSKNATSSIQQVYPLILHLDLGQIQEDSFLANRKDVATQMGLSEQDDFNDLWNLSLQTLDVLKKAKEEKEPIRIWVAKWIPSELCGLYYLLSYLNVKKAPIHVVWLPKFERSSTQKQVMYEYANSGELTTDRILKCLAFEEVVDDALWNTCINKWYCLTQENAELRSILHGCLISVPLNFYDTIILSQIPKQFTQIGMVLGSIHLYINGVVDEFYVSRILKLVKDHQVILSGEKQEENVYKQLIKLR